jgi:hypothetical protein
VYGYGSAITQDEAHGDAWAARIRAQHAAAGASCPCGNHVERAHVYTLHFDAGPPETVRAATPSEAVKGRTGRPFSALPHTITDETAMAAWIKRRQAIQNRGLTDMV